MKTIIFPAMLAVAAAMVAPVAAQTATCADREHVVTQLQARFGETLRGNSLSTDNRVMEIYASPNARSWTILVSLPERGLSCLIASGRGADRLRLNIAAL
jgi:hypothetical protein